MKVKVTNVKAPWPEGAEIGSIVSFKGDAPAWATGKFAAAPDSAKADFNYEPPVVVEGDGLGVALPLAEAINAQVADLQAQLAAAQDANGKLVLEKESAEAALIEAQKAHDAEAADLRKQLAAAQEAATAKASSKGNSR